MKPFYFHYMAKEKKMVLHYQGQEIVRKHIECRVPVWTKYQSSWPSLIMKGRCNRIRCAADKIVIE